MTLHTSPQPAGSLDSKQIRLRLEERGQSLPTPWQVPSTPGSSIPASLVRRVSNRLYVSGHIPTDADGNVTGPYGKVGDDVDLATAQQAAVRTVLSLIASVEKAVGDLGVVEAWCSLHCMVNSAAGFTDFPAVFNPASQLLVDAFGPDAGAHARVAVGVAGLPWDLPVEIEAEVQLRT
ncbi:RidA family protein [Streptomyces sp. Li-HN-5-11]|uniref:RidA family protein n=1 Tax=Streptomyces sp. Li-HN-5-11 TaxID=3075432 RepID=UPI0028B07458|nr:RidA family protein [Streptomyces sp. Li-HN-5-11]WNM29989.1 RidA family protein [Streptomyces sp. Li-HN-5-11]